MTEYEIGTNLSGIITVFLGMLTAYLSGRGIIHVCNKRLKPNGSP